VLLPLSDVQRLLRSPATGQPVKYESTSSTYRSGSPGDQFACINECPILVDFENSVIEQSWVESGKAESVIERASDKSISTKLRHVITRPSKTTANNVGKLIDYLHTLKKPRLLVVGGGAVGGGMQPLYDDPLIGVVGFDIYLSNNVQLVADAHAIPFADESFDAVVVQAVLEHVLDPHQVVGEIHRVLKPTGQVYAETPFMQQVHKAAFDFTRFSDSGHRYLFKQFNLIGSGAVAGAGTALMWSIEHFVRGLFRSRRIGKIAKLVFFWLQYLDGAVAAPYNVDSASAVYFYGSRCDVSINRKDIITYYNGSQ